MSTSSLESFSDPTRVTNTLRLIWVLMLSSLLLAFGAVSGLINAGQLSSTQQEAITPIATNLQIASWCLVIFSFVFGHIIRMQIYKKNWQGSSITPNGYLKGMGIFMALNYMCNFCNLIILICLSITFTYALPMMIGYLLLFINFPNGKPLKQNA